MGKRKQRSDKKSEDQIEIERLQQELQEQEKTTAKLSTLLVLQKNFRYAKKERLNLNIEEKKRVIKNCSRVIDAGITIEKFCDSVECLLGHIFFEKDQQ
ncbi:MAG: hypothetical protein HOP07_18565 [Bacteriovoracaceae bacterium]|nr:hypothetical protein [Bacteriovoracaceae bacterium]